MKLYSDCLSLLDSATAPQTFSNWQKADLFCCIAMCELAVKAQLGQEMGQALRQAETTLSKALEAEAHHVPSLLQIAIVRAVLGDVKAAEANVRKAVVNAVAQAKTAASNIKIGEEQNEIKST